MHKLITMYNLISLINVICNFCLKICVEYTIFNTLSTLEERFQEICTHLRDVVSLVVMRRRETVVVRRREDQ